MFTYFLELQKNENSRWMQYKRKFLIVKRRLIIDVHHTRKQNSNLIISKWFKVLLQVSYPTCNWEWKKRDHPIMFEDAAMNIIYTWLLTDFHENTKQQGRTFYPPSNMVRDTLAVNAIFCLMLHSYLVLAISSSIYFETMPK